MYLCRLPRLMVVFESACLAASWCLECDSDDKLSVSLQTLDSETLALLHCINASGLMADTSKVMTPPPVQLQPTKRKRKNTYWLSFCHELLTCQ